MIRRPPRSTQGVSSAASDVYKRQGQDEIWAHDMKLADAVIEGAMSMGLEVVSPIDPEQRSAIVSIRTPQGEDSSQIVRRLQDEFGILVTDRSGMIRVSPHIDNDTHQIEMLFRSLRTILGKTSS